MNEQPVVESPPPGRRVRIPTFVIGLVAVALVAGLIGKGVLFGAGGASSPTEAVQQLADALAAEDLAAALTTLSPDEVRDAGDVYASASTKLRNLGVTPEDKTLGGIDLRIEGLQLREQMLGPDVAKVAIVGGRATAAWDLDRMGEVAQDVEEEWAVEDETDRTGSESADLADLTYEDGDGHERPAFLMAVRRDGGWYVSPFYSVAELTVSATGSAPGDFGPVELGPAAPTPDAAVDRLAAAFGAHSIGDVVDALPSGEWAVLRTYRAAIEDAMTDAIGDSDDPEDDITIDDIATTTRALDGDTSLVSVESATGHATTRVVSDEEWQAYEDAMEASDWESDLEYPEGSVHELRWTLDDGCFRVEDLTDGTEDTDSCADATSDEIGMFMPTFDTRSYLRNLGIVVVRDRDGWAVSPVATMFRALRTFVDDLDEDQIATITGSELDRAPSTDLVEGQEVKVPLNGAGWAVAGFDATKGVPLTIDGVDDDFGELRVRAPDGDDDWAWGTYVPQQDGVHRILLHGKPNGTATVVVREIVPTGEVTVGDTLPIELDATRNVIATTLVVPEGATAAPELADLSSATLTVLDDQGRDVEELAWDDEDYTGDGVELEPGRYLVMVTLDDVGFSFDDESDEPESVSTTLRILDPARAPHFLNGTDGTSLTPVTRTPLGPDVAEEDGVYLEIPAGETWELTFSTDWDDSAPSGVAVRCEPQGPWTDSGDVAFDEQDGSLRIDPADHVRRCDVWAVSDNPDAEEIGVWVALA